MKKLFAFIKSRVFWLNVAVALLFYVILFYGGQWGLKLLTGHGQVVQVPDVTALNYRSAESMLEAEGLKMDVLDSSVYFPDRKPGEVLDQYPAKAMEVKKGRVIMLTLNRHTPERVVLPKLVERTLQRATIDIASRGLEVGEIRYVVDLAENVVLGVEFEGEALEEGDELRKGQTVDLVVGRREGRATIAVPDVSGMRLGEAKAILQLAGLTSHVAAVDSSQGVPVVIKQEPQPSGSIPIMGHGATISIWLGAPGGASSSNDTP